MTKKKLGPRKPGSGGARLGTGPKKGTGKWLGDTLAVPVRGPNRRIQLVKGLAKRLGRTVPEVLAMIIDQYVAGGSPEQRALLAESKMFQAELRARRFERALGEARDETHALVQRNKDQAYELREMRKRVVARLEQRARAGELDVVVPRVDLDEVAGRLRNGVAVRN